MSPASAGSPRFFRSTSPPNALAPAIEAGEIDVVVIHDAARPLAVTTMFASVIDAAVEHGGAIPVRLQSNLTGLDPSDPPPGHVVAVHTPQTFRARPLLEAYRRAHEEGFVGNDTVGAMLLAMAITTAAPVNPARAQSAAPSFIDFDWVDASRSRAVPARLKRRGAGGGE